MQVKNERTKEAIKVTLIGSVIDFVLGTGKIIIGFLFNSHALIIDGIHSFSDLFTDFFVIFISKFANEEPDSEHPYGHEKFETIGTTAMGAILLATAGALVYETTLRLINFNDIESAKIGAPALLMTVISILGKEAIFQYSKKVGEKLNSSILIANAWHSRTDAISSVIVLVGLVLSYFGYTYFDSIAAIIVAIMIGKVGWEFISESLKELAESSINPEKVKEFEKHILSIPEIKGMHNLRTRKMGHKSLLDVNIEVSDRISVSEGHEISSWVSKILINTFDDVTDVTVHTDVENDLGEGHVHELNDLLPLRHSVITSLDSTWAEMSPFKFIKDCRLHYRNQKIFLEFFLTEDQQAPSEQEISQLNELAKRFFWYGGITFWKSVYQISQK